MIIKHTHTRTLTLSDRYTPVYGGGVDGPGGVYVPLSDDGDPTVHTHQHPVTATGVTARLSVQVIMVITHSGHQGEKILNLITTAVHRDRERETLRYTIIQVFTVCVCVFYTPVDADECRRIILPLFLPHGVPHTETRGKGRPACCLFINISDRHCLHHTCTKHHASTLVWN